MVLSSEAREQPQAKPSTRFRPDGLETEMRSWKFYMMNAVKVDQARRIRLPELRPGDYYEPAIGPNGEHITLRRLKSPRPRLTAEEIRRRIRRSKLRFARTWEEMRADTREP